MRWSWLGLDWDEGPIFQMQNAERHHEAFAQLLADGHAYHSNATAEDVRPTRSAMGRSRLPR